MRPSLQTCAGVLWALALSMLGVAAAAAPAAQGPAVVELFTSQGCSSCPPADALLNKLSEMPGVLTLSFSVDYWDYLGWHDTLGSPANSERQRDYARARGDGRVYRPQAVVDGLLHINGADERLVLDAQRNAQDRRTIQRRRDHHHGRQRYATPSGGGWTRFWAADMQPHAAWRAQGEGDGADLARRE